MVLKSTSIHILEQKQEREREREKKKKKRFIVLQSPLFLYEVVFVTGVSSRRLVILMFYLDKSMAHYFIYSLPVCINALFACYMPLLTIQVIVFNILNQARSRFRKVVAVLRRTQNFLSSDIPLTNINPSSDIPASYLRHPVTNKYDNNPKEI